MYYNDMVCTYLYIVDHIVSRVQVVFMKTDEVYPHPGDGGRGQGDHRLNICMAYHYKQPNEMNRIGDSIILKLHRKILIKEIYAL